MFAKLKEKIQKEGGNVSEGEKTRVPLPGHASPRRLSVAGSPSESPRKKDVLEDSFSLTSGKQEDLSKTDFGSNEEVLTALQKRNEQCRVLEAKVTEFGTVIKDNTKKIEKLENYIEKQQDALAKRSQELNEQYQMSRVKLSDKFKQELEQKEKDKQNLLEKLRETDGMREKYYKTEEEKEEMQQSTTQETGKLKHMLILKEEELSKCQRELLEFQEENKELIALKDKIKSLESDRCTLEEENSGHGNIIIALNKDRISIEENLTQVRSQLTNTSTAYCSLQAIHTELENTHQTLVRNSDLHKHKASQQLQECTDVIEQLEDRVKLLQQREHDQTLSGDDRLIAIDKERDGLERKLAETREQLSQIKSTWSEKISHLEDQISHLNGKIVEDGEELADAKKYAEAVQDSLLKEVDNLKQKLQSSEKQLQEHVDLVSRKEARFKKERLELETEVSKTKLEKIDLETRLRAKLTSVETQLMTLEMLKAQEKSDLEETIKKLEKKVKEYQGKLETSEQLIKTLEENRTKLEAEIKELQSTKKSMKEGLNHTEKQWTESKAHALSLQEEVILTQEKLNKALHSSKAKSTELIESNNDKDGFMLRNAELSQQLTTLQQTSQDVKCTLELELKNRTDGENELMLRYQALETRVKDLSELQADHHNKLVVELQDTVSGLEEQLTEKNKTLKKQEQRLNDLKKTLQRELKVQTLPNDEPIDPKVTALTPPLPRKNSYTHHSDHLTRTRRISSHERSPIGNDSVMDSTDGNSTTVGTQDFFLGDGSPYPGHRLNSDRISYAVQNSHATISVNDNHSAATQLGAYSSLNNSGYSRTVTREHSQGHLGYSRTVAREFDTRHLEKDINFQYLKHVVMKFMLSREHEAIQLIKAVSLLLRFTPDEQKLIRDTLEWKMSWFGGANPPAILKGQTNKIVPPSW